MKPGPENVDYTSAEWKQGYDDGKAGRECRTELAKDTQPYFNYLEGWLMGDAEKGFDPDEVERSYHGTGRAQTQPEIQNLPGTPTANLEMRMAGIRLTCKWTREEPEDDEQEPDAEDDGGGRWNTACRDSLFLFDGDPINLGMRYCCFCGRVLTA